MPKRNDERLSVYAMLGYADYKSMEIKAGLAAKILETMEKRGLKQGEAAEIAGIPQPKLSGIIRGKFRGISEAKMMACLVALGNDVKIVVQTPAVGHRASIAVVSGSQRRQKRAKAQPALPSARKPKQPPKASAC